MKYFSYYTVLFLTSLLLFATACGGDDDKDGAQLSIKIVKTTIDSDPAALTGEIEFSASNFTYEVSGGEWCTVQKEGNLLKLSSKANYDFQNRTVEVVVQAGKSTLRIPVTQKGIVFELTSKSRNHFNFSLLGGERNVEFLTNIKYDIVIPTEYQDWISVVDAGDNAHNIVVGESSKATPTLGRRNGKVTFKYLEKEIVVTINQFDYLSYNELLGPALMSYTDSAGVRRDTVIELLVREENVSFTLKGTFASGVERELPLYYIDDDTYNGELRFKSTALDATFEDPDYDSRIKSLWFLIYATEYYSDGRVWANPYRPTGSQYYYPAEMILEGAGTRFKFFHATRGIPNPSLGGRYRITDGMLVIGTSTSGAPPSGIKPYETLFNIEIFKE